MKIIGLTGSIGMGKSTVANMFAQENIPTIDADQIVHDLYENEAVAPIEARFPGTFKDGKIDRSALSKYVIGDPQAFLDLEAIIHPLVRQKQDEFISYHRSKHADMVLIDIPLLFETNAQDRFDVVIVVSCDEKTQRDRVLARDGMTQDKFQSILNKQMPDHKKRELADHIVDTSVSLAETKAQIIALLHKLRHG